jgi:BCD family chlorophyll transporter-like MFS transporter
MTLVPINSTLNRVMIKELDISAALVAILASLPYLFSPIQVAIGSFSDRYPLFGFRRTPYILAGFLLCVIGMIILPQIAFLMAEQWWLGLFLSILAFGAWGMGYNLATVSYFSLASEISGEKYRSRTIAAMFFMMILVIILTSILLGQLLESYSPALLSRSFLIVGGLALIMGLLGLIGLESRTARGSSASAEGQSWRDLYQTLTSNRQVTLFFWYLILLLTAILGQDILLEPYGAEAFNLPVDATTRITSIWGVCFLLSLTVGGALETRLTKLVIAKIGAWSAVVAFVLIVVSGPTVSLPIFYSGVLLLGLATGLSTVSNLSLMLDMTVAGNVGLFIGAWGMASALARLVGNVLSGVIRDVVAELSQNAIAGYSVVFTVEMGMLLVSLWLLRQVDVSVFRSQVAEETPLIERAAMADIS